MLRALLKASPAPHLLLAMGIAAGCGPSAQTTDGGVSTDAAPLVCTVKAPTACPDPPPHYPDVQPIIERNRFVPISRVERLFTVADNQTQIEVKIYQGESPFVKDNIFLGRLKVVVPRAPAGEQAIEVRFTYDINGILEVIVKVVGTGEQKSLVIEENPGVLSQEEVAARLSNLQALKIHPRELQENTAAINRAERLYRESLGEQREAVGRCLAEFDSILERQDPREIAAARTRFIESLDQLEGEFRF